MNTQLKDISEDIWDNVEEPIWDIIITDLTNNLNNIDTDIYIIFIDYIFNNICYTVNNIIYLHRNKPVCQKTEIKFIKELI